MWKYIVLLVLHTFCCVGYALCASKSPTTGSQVAYSICSALWGMCSVVDIVQITAML